MCDRKRVIDPSEQEAERKSIPLYREVKFSRNLIRAKYVTAVNKVDLDFDQITLSLVDQGDALACRGLGVVNCINQAVARGSEPLYLRYTGSNFCRYFNAWEVDWPQVKQVDIQLILFFCDRRLFNVCPIFGIGVHWLHGGARREDVCVHDFAAEKLGTYA